MSVEKTKIQRPIKQKDTDPVLGILVMNSGTFSKGAIEVFSPRFLSSHFFFEKQKKGEDADC